MAAKSSFRRTHLGKRKLSPTTQMTAYGYNPLFSEGSVKPPVFLTSTFTFQSAEEGAEFFDEVAGRKPVDQDRGAGGLVYSRFNHPNCEIVEDRLAILDGTESALITSSGMAAISSLFLTFARPGDSIVHYSPLYGGTETLLSNYFNSWGVTPMAFFDGLADAPLTESLTKAYAKGPVKIVYLETPANPTNSMIDLAMCRQVVDKWSQSRGIASPLIVCDNTLLGPVFQKPHDFGIDLCIYSLTKYIGGHSDLIAGAITGKKALLHKLRLTRSSFGFQLDPHSSWMLTRSLETVFLRMERAAKSGVKVAEWLAGNKLLPCKLLHPHFLDDQTKNVYERQCTGPGSTFSFVVEENRQLAFKILNELQLFQLAVSLGGTESLVCHPASTTHSGVPVDIREKVGISEGMIRLSVGLEDPDDLIEDLRQAFAQARK
ncbi:cystathionine gamma-synthase family protein [Desulfosediminicola ganghwensis]|uniref:cystathionine gamma-synthase family protein n=1 Tax=Desulfosediminicola ganghwensis TaxID=2569540 RepID=UPI0010ABE2A3